MDFYKINCAQCTHASSTPITPQYTPLPPGTKICNSNETVDERDPALYALWHRRMEAMQHAVQSQMYRQLSGFSDTFSGPR